MKKYFWTIVNFIPNQWFWYVSLPLRNRREDPTRLLKKMAKIAGYKYEDCVIDDNGKQGWNYKLTWTQAQSDKYEKWFKKQFKDMTEHYKDKNWGMWNLMYGFTIR